MLNAASFSKVKDDFEVINQFKLFRVKLLYDFVLFGSTRDLNIFWKR